MDFTFKSFSKNLNSILVGSDQVWNPDITHFDKKLKGDYFLHTRIKNNVKRFSYASSFGSRKFNKNEVDDINFYLSKLELISIREKEAFKYINKINKKKLIMLLIQFFLYDKKFWINQIKTKKKYDKKKFILVYSVARSKIVKEVVI